MNRKVRKATAVFALAACALSIGARDASSFFVEAPPAVINIFDLNSRLDMLDYHRSGLTTPTGNAIGGKSRVTASVPDLVSVNVSDHTRLDLAVLKVKGDTVIAVIETVETPIPDSSIRFYTKTWQPLPTPPLPVSADFVDKKKLKDVAGDAPAFDFISAEYLPETGLFKFTNNTSDYYVKSELPAMLQAADSVITMLYNGKKFVPAR